MRVIFSRKGFDSENGGISSPILPDGQVLSIPIPENNGCQAYKDLKVGDKTYLDLLKELGRKTTNDELCHLDPDIYHNVLIRPSGWRPLFGQEEAAQGHLRNQHVNKGDLFLFFGWFKKTVEGPDGILAWDRMDKQGKHVLFGYLEIGEIYTVDSGIKLPLWMNSHPHAYDNHRKKCNNTIYVASEKLTLAPSLPGAGTFRLTDKVVLTKPGKSRSCWHLPSFFRELHMTYNPKWEDEWVTVARRGQEFVVHGDGNKELEKWVLDIIRTSLVV